MGSNAKIWLVAVLLPGFAFFAVPGSCGELSPSAAPADGASAMWTLEDIYKALHGDQTVEKRTGPFREPAATPGSTGHTLDDVMDAVLMRYPAPVPKTGQTTSYAAGDDGNLQKGVSWPTPRFTENGNGTVTDNLTGLIWLKNANCFGWLIWNNALSAANGLASGACGLTDDSVAGDWRLPNLKELKSLIDRSRTYPALPSGHPFSGVQTYDYYWSSTAYAYDPGYAWYVYLYYGDVYAYDKTYYAYVWPVRAGQ